MDFVIPVAVDCSRAERRRLVAPLKSVFAELAEGLPCFRIMEPLTGSNNSTQYVGGVSYQSLATGQSEMIKVEVALREPLMTPATEELARTALLNPASGRVLVPPASILCMSKTEAFAEKFRAALSRREVAARDFFDLDYAVRKLALKTDDRELINLVRQKLAIPGNAPMDVSKSRLVELRRLIEPQLRPVLRREDFIGFDVERAFRIVADMAGKVQG